MEISDLKDEKEEMMNYVHNFLQDFLKLYERTPRGSLHDIMEIMICKMIKNAFDNLKELKVSSFSPVTSADENLLVSQVILGFQNALTNYKNELDRITTVNH